jgi:ABC-2 type transport system ATP-binding protein
MITQTETTHESMDSFSTDAVIEARGLTRYFGSRKVVDSLSMRVPRGSVFAFLGRNGSGKTTTIRMLLGLLDPTRGSSRILGHDSRHLPPVARARVGYIAESHPLYDGLTVRELGAYQSRFYPRWNERIFRTVVDHFRLGADVKGGKLSRGERAGLSLAVTLAPEPELLILDDPALGLDPVARRALLESMLYFTRASGRTIFFSSHLLDDVERVADHIAVIDRSVLRLLGGHVPLECPAVCPAIRERRSSPSQTANHSRVASGAAGARQPTSDHCRRGPRYRTPACHNGRGGVGRDHRQLQ